MAMTPQLGRAPSGSRYRMVLSRSAVVGACALLAAACGSTAAPTAGSSSGTGSTGTVSSSKVSLEVIFSPAGGRPARHWTLRCAPPGGNSPDPAAACAKLVRWGNLFSPPKGHVMCPMIMASAQRVTVDGTYYGKKIHETVVDGGCDLSRWYKLKQIFN
jgi:hypothetical protein